LDVLEAILTRRSIRKFTGQQVLGQDIETLLKAGSQAPSAHNRQPWHFVVIRNKETLEKIAAFHPYGKMLPRAGCGITVCGDSKVQAETGFLVADCSAAIQNILLAAHGIGLGAVWCGLYPMEELTKPISQLLSLPGGIIPVGIVAVGNKDEQKEPTDRFDRSKVHMDRW
jgi:nitroreductase